MKIYITRHSKTLWNQEKRLQGWKDSELTEQGINDALKLKNRLINLKIDCCYSSPIGRAKKTSEILFESFITDDRLKEMNFGIYEGKKINNLLDNEEYFNLWNHPGDNVRLTGGESYLEVKTRLHSFFSDIYKENTNKTVFITIHGMLFVILYGMMLNYSTEDLVKINHQIVRGCSLSEVEFDGKNFKINYIGDDSHLDYEEVISYK